MATDQLLALDWVLIPSEESVRHCIRIANEHLPQPNGIALHPTLVVPHLSLAMGILPADHESMELISLAKELFSEPLTCTVTSTYTASTTAGEVLGLNVANSEALQHLHEAAWEVVKDSSAGQRATTTTQLADADKADPITLDWINNFHKGTGPSWNPHVTLGFGPGNLDVLHGITLVFDRLALYQLGGYCTCQRLLGQYFL